MENIERLANARNPAKRCQARIALATRNQESFHDEGAIDTFQRNHVANCRKCHQIEQREKVRPRPLATFAQNFCHLNKRQKNNARGAQMLLL